MLRDLKQQTWPQKGKHKKYKLQIHHNKLASSLGYPFVYLIDNISMQI